MSGELIRQERQLSLAELKEYGAIMSKSGVFKDVGSAERAIVKIEIGRSLGIDAATSLRGIHVFDGKVELGVGIISLLIKRSGKYDYHVMQHSENGCAIKFMNVMEDGSQKPISWQLGDERPKDSGVSMWTQDDTVRAGLEKKDNHKKYPAAMNFSRALTQGARWFCPDVFGGSIYAIGEISDLAPDDMGIPSVPATKEPVVQDAAVALPPVAAKEDGATDVPFEPATSTPASTPDPEPVSEPDEKAPKPLAECSKEELIERCKSGFKELGIAADTAKRILARKGAAKLADLSDDQLRELAGNLFDKIMKSHMTTALS